jgi:hypothetical protein
LVGKYYLNNAISKSEREQEQGPDNGMMERDADCRLSLKAGQAVGAGDSFFDCNYINIFTWKACFVQGLNFYSAHFFYAYLYDPVIKPAVNIILRYISTHPFTPIPVISSVFISIH